MGWDFVPRIRPSLQPVVAPSLETRIKPGAGQRLASTRATRAPAGEGNLVGKTGCLHHRAVMREGEGKDERPIFSDSLGSMVL